MNTTMMEYAVIKESEVKSALREAVMQAVEATRQELGLANVVVAWIVDAKYAADNGLAVLDTLKGLRCAPSVITKKTRGNVIFIDALQSAESAVTIAKDGVGRIYLEIRRRPCSLTTILE